MIAALLIQGLCTGVFAGILELEANAVFLETFGADRVPLGLMISGAAGILITTIYSYFSKQLGVKPFGILNLVAVLVITAALATGSRVLSLPQFDFAIFVISGPLILITLMGFWITVKGFLSPSHSKQLSGLIDASLVGGMVASFFATPLLVRWGVHLRHVLYLGMGSLLLAAFAQLYVLNYMSKFHHRFRKRVKSTGPLRLLSHRFTGLISSFVLLGVSVAVLLHYAFLWVAGSRYPGGIELVSFLGFFAGITLLVAWVMKRLLFGWIKHRMGLRTTLLLSPVLLLMLTIASAIVGESYGFTGEAYLFSYFFWLVAGSKFLVRTMKESMEDPSLRLIYQSLDPKERLNVQSGVEGVMSQIGFFSAGLFLACFVLITFVEIHHVTYVIFIFLVAWFFVGAALYRHYHRMLKVTLESDRVRESVDLDLKELVAADLWKTAFPVELLEFNPFFFHYSTREELTTLLSHPNTGVRRRIWDHMLQTSPVLSELTISQLLVREKVPELKDRIRRLGQRRFRNRLGLQEAFIRERLERFNQEKTEPENSIGEAFQSGVRNEIFAALYHVAEHRDSTYLAEVISVLREEDPQLQGAALTTAGLVDRGRNGVRMIDFLDHPQLYATAWSALVCQGESVLEELEASFHRPEAEWNLQVRILSVISAIGGRHSIQLLLDKLNYHHREVFQAVVRGLYGNQFQATELEAAMIQNAILKLVQTGTWNMAARIAVRTDDPGGSLAVAIEHEIWDVNELILMLMSMIYDRRSVRRIRTSLLDRSSDDRTLSIELLELLVAEPLKTVLTAYFHDVTVREKIDKLRELYTLDIFPVDVLLKKILNRDGTQMGDFIRICVLERMGNDRRFFDEQQIIAQGFHPNPRIRETAAQILRKNDPERYHLVTERLDFPDNSFPGHEDPAGWYMDITIKLAAWKLFMNVGINSLFKLVSCLEPYSEEVVAEGDYVVMARSAFADEFTPLSSGIAIIAAHQPEILEQIRYLGTIGTCESYLIERGTFIELLFEDRGLLHVFCAFLSQTAKPEV